MYSFIIALLAVFTPLVVYGGTPFPDTWIHLSISHESIRNFHVPVLKSYNTDWPLVNMIITLTSMVTGLEPLKIVPLMLFLNALSIVPIMMLVYRSSMEKASREAYLSMAVILSFEVSMFTLITSIQKESSVLLLANTVLYITLSDNSKASILLPFLIIALALGHHYYSLYILLYFITIFLYDVLLGLTSNEKTFTFTLHRRTLIAIILSLILLIVYEGYAGSLHLKHFLGYSFSIQDYMVLLSAFIVAFLVIYKRRNTIVRPFSQVVIIATVLIVYYLMRSGRLLPMQYGMKFQLPELIIVSGYILFILNVFQAKNMKAERALIPGVALLLYSFFTVQFAGGITLTVKAIRKIVPAMILQVSSKPIKKLLIPASVCMFFTMILFVLGYPLVGGPSIYTYNEVVSTRYFVHRIHEAGNIPKVYGSWRFVEMSKYFGLNASILSPYIKPSSGLVVFLEGDIRRGFLSTSWYLLYNVKNLPHGHDLIYNSRYLLVYR